MMNLYRNMTVHIIATTLMKFRFIKPSEQKNYELYMELVLVRYDRMNRSLGCMVVGCICK